MELRVLRYFLAVVDAGSVTAAARAVHVAQPAISRQLRALEAELGVSLFRPSRRPFQLSAAGERFLPVARDLVGRADQAMHVLGLGGSSVRLTVVAPAATESGLLAPFIARGLDGGALGDVRIAHPAAVYDALARGEGDLGISPLPPPRTLIGRTIDHIPVLALTADHRHGPAPSRRTLAELVVMPLILLTRHNVARTEFDRAVSDAGLRYEPPHEAGSGRIAQALAAAGRGVCVVADVAEFGLGSSLIDLGGDILRIPLYGAWDRTHYANDTINAVVDAVSSFSQANTKARLATYEPSS